jgi:hypothetical protein
MNDTEKILCRMAGNIAAGFVGHATSGLTSEEIEIASTELALRLHSRIVAQRKDKKDA